MDYEITPEPDEDERRAILEALAEEEAVRAPDSAWAEALRPVRDGAEP